MPEMRQRILERLQRAGREGERGSEKERIRIIPSITVNSLQPRRNVPGMKLTGLQYTVKSLLQVFTLIQKLQYCI